MIQQMSVKVGHLVWKSAFAAICMNITSSLDHCVSLWSLTASNHEPMRSGSACCTQIMVMIFGPDSLKVLVIYDLNQVQLRFTPMWSSGTSNSHACLELEIKNYWSMLISDTSFFLVFRFFDEPFLGPFMCCINTFQILNNGNDSVISYFSETYICFLLRYTFSILMVCLLCCDTIPEKDYLPPQLWFLQLFSQ